MKIYEKPMATIENIDVVDVITTSGEGTLAANTAEAAALKAATAADEAIVFEW